jgi:N-acetylglucosaminyldiphosphoundecaprenol N-acetyl-beta-D-mannosaminyltransferase
MKNKKINLFGTEIDSLTMEETICIVDKIIQDRTPRQHVVVNALKFAMMNGDPELKKIVNACDMISADGLPVVWASRIFSQPLPERVAGVDLFQNLVRSCSQKGYHPFFFGAREKITIKTVKNLKEKYPSLKVAGYRNGYFTKEQEPEVAEMIRNSRADMLFVGISSPTKEIFLNKWMEYMQIPFCMGVGGSFDIIAGKTKRAPVWMQEAGLEWFYRVLQEPRRMWKRYATTNSIFVWMVLKEYFRSNGKGLRWC